MKEIDVFFFFIALSLSLVCFLLSSFSAPRAKDIKKRDPVYTIKEWAKESSSKDKFKK